MPLVPAWDNFINQAQCLYLANPQKTRVLIKYSHGKGKISVKVTDDIKTFKYVSDSAADVRKVEQLSLWLASQACSASSMPSYSRPDASPIVHKQKQEQASFQVVKSRDGKRLSGAQVRKLAKEARNSAPSAKDGSTETLGRRQARLKKHMERRERKRARREEKKMLAAAKNISAPE